MHVRAVAIRHCLAILAVTMPVVRTTSNARLKGLALAVTAALCVREVVSEKIIAIPHNSPARPVELTFVKLILETKGAAASHTAVLELLLELPP